MKKIKSIMLFIETLLMLAVVFCMNASAAEWIDIDENTQYTFDEETGVMVVRGEGKLDGSYFMNICYDHYAPKDDLCYCLSDDGEWDAPEIAHPGYFDARATKTLIIQEGITAIDVRAFYGYRSLEVAILPQSLTEIPAGAFAGLEKLHTVVLSNSIISIGESAFSGCVNLKNIYMADTLKTVGEDAFYGCDREVIRIPDSATVEDGILDPVNNLTAVEKKLAVTLSWDKSATAEGYTVKCIQNGKTVTTKDTSYTIKVDTPSKYYTFKVTPYLTQNGKIVYGEEASVMVFTKPEAPKVSVGTARSDSIAISWWDHNDNCEYALYEQQDNGSWKLLAITDESYHTFWSIAPGTKHIYAVRPYHEDYYGRFLGDYTIITAATTPATVTAKPASPSKGKITLTWNAVSGAEAYQLYYKTGNGNYKLYKNYFSAQTVSFSGLKSGTKYTFAVRAAKKTSGGWVFGSFTPVSVTVK